MRFGLENLFIFGNSSYFIAHYQGRNEGGKGHNSPDAESLRGPKSYNNVISTSFNTVHLLPKDLRFEHGGVNLVSYPRRRPTSLGLCTSRLSSQIGEICLQKYLSSGKQSTTNYLNKMLLIQSHLTTENILKVEKRYIISKTSTTCFSTDRNAWGTRRDKHNKKTRKQ